MAWWPKRAQLCPAEERETELKRKQAITDADFGMARARAPGASRDGRRARSVLGG
jgi:hypothetical protein